jgi:glycosyl transferase family 25
MNIQTLVISLKESHARRLKVTEEMSKTSLHWQFLDAVNGDFLENYKFSYNRIKVEKLLGFELTKKEIGCYLSHYNAWVECVEKNIPTVILEDDFIINSNFEEILKSLTVDYQDWQVIRLQALVQSHFSLVKDFGFYQLVRNTTDPLGATAYLLKPESAKQLIQHSVDIYEPVDHFLEHSEKHGLVLLAINPYPVTVVDVTRDTSTITDRPIRPPIKGWKKIKRSISRLLDRLFSKNPYFPK